MTAKSAMNALCIALLPILLLFSGFFLITNQFLYSLIALLVIVACMETRVHMGYRGTRGMTFYLHLVCSVVLLVLLTLFIKGLWLWLVPVAYAAFVGMLISGFRLIRNSWNQVSRN